MSRQNANCTMATPVIPLSPSTWWEDFKQLLSDRQIAELRKKYVFEMWERVDDSHAAVRFVTSWATTEEATAEFAADILACKDL